LQIQVDDDNYFQINRDLKDSIKKGDVVVFEFGETEVTARWTVTFLIVETNGGKVKINADFFCDYTKGICEKRGWINGNY
jgi:hypothetical protein